MKKIFLGNNDVASILSDLKVAFNERGVETISVMDRETTSLDRCEVDYNFTKYKKLWFGGVRPRSFQRWLQEQQHIENRIWRKALKECDRFVFLWSSFKQDFSDIVELKRLGKKIIFLFCGNDVRWYYAAKQEYESYNLRVIEFDESYNYSISGLEQRLLRIRMIEKYADHIFSRLDQAQLQLRPYYRYHMWVDSKMIEHNAQQRKDSPLIIHAPSHRKLKGTSFVLDAFNKLKQEGIAFDVLLLENTPNREVLKAYTKADILIDQLIITGTGKISSEALSAGCIVLSHMAYDKYPQNNPSDCPIIDVNPDNIYIELKKIIIDYPKRVELAKRGRKYVEHNLDIRIFSKKLLDLFNNVNMPYDYIPSFYRGKYIPESEVAIPVYNKWNSFVKSCDWYNQYVQSGSRDGLIF